MEKHRDMTKAGLAERYLNVWVRIVNLVPLFNAPE